MKAKLFIAVIFFLMIGMISCSATKVDTTQFLDDPKRIVQDCLSENGTAALKSNLYDKGFNLQKAIWNISGNITQSFSGDYSYYDARGSVKVTASRNGESGSIVWGFKAKVQRNAQGKTRIIELDVS